MHTNAEKLACCKFGLQSYEHCVRRPQTQATLAQHVISH